MAQAETLVPDQARQVFLEYGQEHPEAIKNLAKIVGYEIGDTEDELMDFLELIRSLFSTQGHNLMIFFGGLFRELISWLLEVNTDNPGVHCSSLMKLTKRDHNVLEA